MQILIVNHSLFNFVLNVFLIYGFNGLVVFVDMLDLKDSMLCLVIANVLGVDWALKE